MTEDIAAVAGNYVYIDGGEFSFRDNGTTWYASKIASHAPLLIKVSQHRRSSQSIYLKTGQTQQLLSSPQPSLLESSASTVHHFGIMTRKAFCTQASLATSPPSGSRTHYLPSQYGVSSPTTQEAAPGPKSSKPMRQH